jgi:multidrug efflux pump subunit AcrB
MSPPTDTGHREENELPPGDTARLFNLAGHLSNIFVESKLTLLLIIGVALIGYLGFEFTPREENPQIIVPAAEVRVNATGLSTEEVEHLVLSPLESAIKGISGIKHYYGTARNGAASVAVEFEVGEDEENALVRLYDQILRKKIELPAGVGEPTIIKVDPDDVPIFVVTLTSTTLSADTLRPLAQRLEERLRGEKGVGATTVVGGRPKEIHVALNPSNLAAYGSSLPQIQEAIASANRTTPLATRVVEGRLETLKLQSALDTAEDVRNVVIGTAGKRVIRLQDVADIYEGPPESRWEITRFSYGPADPRFAKNQGEEMAAVHVAVSKLPGVNAVTLNKTLRDRIDLFSSEFIPNDVNVIITRDDGLKADNAVSTLVLHFYIAVGAVTLILLFFLGRYAALIVIIAIPLVFAIVLGADFVAGPTLNRITFYALIMALGMLVDDAIVVVENIHRHFCRLPEDASRESRSHSAVLATNEIGNPTTLATLTVVVVFLSLIMVTGMLGQYFNPVTFNVPVAMIASLIIAYTVTPWAARRWLPTGHHDAKSGMGWLRRTYRAYGHILLTSRKERLKLLLILIVLLIASSLQPAWQFLRPAGISGPTPLLGVPLGFLPKDNKNTFLVHIHLPDTTPLEKTDQAAREVEELLRGIPHVRDLQAFIGIPSVVDFNGQLKGSSANVGPQFAEIRVNLVDKSERTASSIGIVKDLRPQLSEIASRYPGGVFQLVEDPPGPPVRATVLAELYGTDLDVLRASEETIAEAFRQTHDMAEVWTSSIDPLPEHQLTVNRDKAALSGVSVADVEAALQAYVSGVVLDHVYRPDDRNPIPIRLYVPREQRINPDALHRVSIKTPDGKSIPLSELTTVRIGKSEVPILHKNGERVVYVGGELADSAPVYAVVELDKQLDGMDLGGGEKLVTANLRFQGVRANTLEGSQLLWGGEIRLTLDAFRDMGLALGAAVIAVLMLLVGYYRSFGLPLIAMSSIPLALIGVFPAHWLFGQTFSAASMIGVIALVGLVVRNSLLIIDFIQDNLSEGKAPEDAALEAGEVRLRPIMFTTLAIVLGTSVLVPDPVFGGMALSLIFGSITSAVMTLYVVPILMVRRENRRMRNI